jgi:hypothetical protein
MERASMLEWIDDIMEALIFFLQENAGLFMPRGEQEIQSPNGLFQQ